MADIAYQNLDVQIEPATGQYHVRVQCPPLLGEDEADISLPFTPGDLKTFFGGLGQTRDFDAAEPATPTLSLEEFGRRLYSAVFTGRLETFLARCQDGAATAGQRLRIRLRLNRAPDLLNLPWEYLYNADHRRYLALAKETSIVRYLDLAERIPTLKTAPPLRILVMLAGPKDAPQLDVEREWANLKQALQPLEQAGQVVVDRLPKATLGALREQLDAQAYHVFHFIGHGGFDKAQQDGLLLLEDDFKAKRPALAQTVGQYLHNSPSLRLVVLNACEGGRSGETDPFAGTAQTLMLQNIPAVVAMQFSISDRAAIAFAGEFYRGVTRGLALDAAMTNARFAIQEQANDREWGTPVLYMRASDGYIFDVPAGPAGSQTPVASVTPSTPTTTSPTPATQVTTSGGSAVPTDDKYSQLAPHVRLRELLIDYFQLSDLQLLCDDLQIPFDDLEGGVKKVKVLSLIQYCKNRRRIGDLIQAARTSDPSRADLPWPNPADIK